MEGVESYVPAAFLCPITHSVMIRPVSTVYGHSYEETDLLQWLASSKTDPVTRDRLSEALVFPNRALQDAISAHLKSLIEDSQGPQARHEISDDVLSQIRDLLQQLEREESRRWTSRGQCSTASIFPLVSNRWAMVEKLADSAHMYFWSMAGGIGGIILVRVMTWGVLTRVVQDSDALLPKSHSGMEVISTVYRALWWVASSNVNWNGMCGILSAAGGAALSLAIFVSLVVFPPPERRRAPIERPFRAMRFNLHISTYCLLPACFVWSFQHRLLPAIVSGIDRY
mmetsp:Transcript_63402/g.138055  ORF Transcript_63402/g.138055 Transcript_63402/m.138055 type:complete len:284 (+) Transcript_63402:60-911(+)